MLDSLSPARRRMVLAVAALALVAVLGAVALVVSRLPDPVDPVAQDQRGPVLLVAGYGGRTGAVESLAAALREDGRTAVVVPPLDDNRGDLREQAAALDERARALAADSPAGSVDVVGYSAGGVVARLWVAEGGGSIARRVVTLGSPHHGTEVAALAAGVAPDACPTACRQLDLDSDLLRGLNSGDETPPGPEWVAIWTTDDQTVVPPDSGRLDGALSYAVQSVCPGLVVEHRDLPRTPAVIEAVRLALAVGAPTEPSRAACDG